MKCYSIILAGLLISSHVFGQGGRLQLAPPVVLPAATSTTLGGVKIGAGLTITADGTLSGLSGGSTYTGNALLIFDGNSITFGKTSNHTITSTTDFAAGPYAATARTALISQFALASFTAYNFGVDGQTTDQMLSDVTTQVDPLFNASSFDRNIVFAWEITNQKANGSGYTDQQCIDNFVAYCKGRRTKGFLVVAATVLPRTSFLTGISAADFETSRQVINNYLRAHYLEFSDKLCDVDKLGVNRPDGTHPDQAGHDAIGALVAQTIAPLLVTGFNPQSIPFLLAGVTSGTVSGGTSSSGTSSTATGYVTALTTQPQAAYGLRKLLTAYTGSAVRVRRSSDNTESDIGFTSAGLIDQTALLAFAGSGSAYVKTWYDQKGSNNLTQTNTGNQPRIVNAGAVVKANSVPTVEALASSPMYMDAAYINTGSQVLISSAFNMRSATTTFGRLFSVGVVGSNDYDNNLYFIGLTRNNSIQTATRNNTNFSGTNGTVFDALQTATSGFNGTTGILTINGTQVSSLSSTGNFGPSTLRIFGHVGNTSDYFDGFCSEILVFNTYPSSTDLSTIQTNQKSFFATP